MKLNMQVMMNIFLLVSFIATGAHAHMAESYIEKARRAGNTYLISNVTYFDGEQFVHGENFILVVDGFIEKICDLKSKKVCLRLAENYNIYKEARIDAEGKYLVPGFINSESHIVNPKELFHTFSTTKIEELRDSKGLLLRPHITKLFQKFSSENKFTEINTHGLYWGHSTEGYKLGQNYPLTESSGMEKPLRFGVTTIFDMQSHPSFTNYFKRSRNKMDFNSENQESVHLNQEFLLYPDTFSSGMWAHAPNLHYFLFGVDPVYNLKPNGPWSEANINDWVQRQKMLQSDYIKVYYDDKNGQPSRPAIDRETLKTLIRLAHQENLKVIVHALSLREATEAVEFGADGIMHTVVRGGKLVDDRLIQAYKKSNTFNIPTLTVLSLECDNKYSISNRWTHNLGKGGFINQYYNSAFVKPYVNHLDDLRNQNCEEPYSNSHEAYKVPFKNVGTLLKEGIPVLAGTDSGGSEPSVEGVNLHYEAYLIAQAAYLFGGSKYQGNKTASNIIGLKSMTSVPARMFGLASQNSLENDSDNHKRGFIRVGYRADLVILNSNPEENILNTLDINEVFKGGYRLDRSMMKVR